MPQTHMPISVGSHMFNKIPQSLDMCSHGPAQTVNNPSISLSNRQCPQPDPLALAPYAVQDFLTNLQFMIIWLMP